MIDDRFWTKVDKSHPSGCWIWTANRNNRGYGLFRPGGSTPKRLAHRLSFEEAYGQIPEGGLILHSCDNPSCVNPGHLRLGTHSDNVADMDARNRRNSNPLRGAKNPNTTMTSRRVAAIRRAYVSGLPISAILTKYKITEHALADYVSGRSWAHTIGGKGCPGIAALKAEAEKRRRSAAKLTRNVAEEIRLRLSLGARGVDLAPEYGVTASTISDIKRRKIWR